MQKFSLLLYVCVSNVCKNRVIEFNNQLIENKGFIEYEYLDSLMKEHNNMCRDVQKYNQFWRKYLFVIYYLILPLNLICIHLLLFVQLIALLKGLIITTLTITTIYSLLFKSVITTINTKSVESNNYLQVYYSNNHLVLNVKRKIKVSMQICVFKLHVLALFSMNKLVN